MKKLESISTYSLILILLWSGCSSEDAEPPTPAPQAPSINRIEPDQGKFGDLITITGLNFGSSVAENKVTFNGAEATITDANPNRLVAEVPRGSGSGFIQVSTGIGIGIGPHFTYLLRAVVETVAGTGEPGFKNGMGEQSQFFNPMGLFMKEDGTLLIADANNQAVRATFNGTVSTVLVAKDHRVNDVHVGLNDKGENSLFIATTPDFNGLIFRGWIYEFPEEPGGFSDGVCLVDDFIPGGITTSPTAGFMFIADRTSHRIHFRNLHLEKEGFFTGFTIAGSPNNPGYVDGGIDDALLQIPSDLQCVINGTGLLQLFFSDRGNHSIRQTEVLSLNGFNPNSTTITLAGNGQPGFADGAGNLAQFNNPQGLDLDDEGNIYVADFRNNAIRKITPDGEVSTILKSEGVVSSSTEPQLIDGPEGVARFNGPYGIAVAPDGSLFVSDFFHHAIRKITFE